MALTSWKIFSFFDVSEISPPDSSFLDSASASVISNGNSTVFVGTHDGQIHLLSTAFSLLRSFKAYEPGDGAVTHIRHIPETSFLVTIAENLSDEPLLKVWALDKSDKRSGIPRCLSSLHIQNGRKPFPISAFACTPDLSQMAAGFGNGSLTAIRGDVINDRGAKQRTVFESEEPITGIEFRVSSTTILFIATTSRILTLSLSGKGQGQPAKMLEDTGCGVNCMTTNRKTGEIIVVRDDAIYAYSPRGRLPAVAYEGHKEFVTLSRQYTVLVSQPPAYIGEINSDAAKPRAQNPSVKRDSTLAIIDTDFSYFAYVETLTTKVRTVLVEGNDIFLISLTGQVFHYREKSLQEKLDILFQRDLYVLAINLAQQAGLDVSQRNDILRRYGDYLYQKGDYDTAMQQYLKAINNTEPSLVIRKYLDTQRIHNLVDYLEELHETGKANVDHTTLLLNCYAKLKDTTKLEAFIRSNSTFDYETAITMCRQGGYFDQAVFLAKKQHETELVVDILVTDLKDYAGALDYLSRHEAKIAYACLSKYARTFLEHRAQETTQLLVDYFTGQYRPKVDQPSQSTVQSSGSTTALANIAHFIPLPYRTSTTQSTMSPNTESGSSSQGLKPEEMAIAESALPPRDYDIPQPRTIFASFVDFSDQFITFLERCVESNEISESDKADLYTTLFEMYLNKANEGDADNRRVWEQKSKQLIDENHVLIDTSNVLLLSHLSDFKEGTTLVREQQGLRMDIFRSYTAAKDTQGAIKALRKYGNAEPRMYGAALAYFASSKEVLEEAGEEFNLVLRKVDDEGLMSPIQVVQTLSATGVATVGLIKTYLSKTIERERNEIAENTRLAKTYADATAAKQAELRSLGSKSTEFRPRRCAACSRNLDLPAVHFMCKHSFHQSCLNTPFNSTMINGNSDDLQGELRKCPICEKENATLRAIRETQMQTAERHDVFRNELARSQDGLAIVSEFLGRGVMAKPPTV